MPIQDHTISAEAFLEMVDAPEYQDRVLELVHCAVVELPLSPYSQGIVTATLAAKIGKFVENNALGETAINAGFLLESNSITGDSVRCLDISYVSKSKELGPPDFAWYELGPDLAVEIISPSNKTSDTHLKVMQLLNAGTRLVWLVYPESRTVVAHTAEGAVTLSERDTLSGGDVLPDFQLRVSEIFPS